MVEDAMQHRAKRLKYRIALRPQAEVGGDARQVGADRLLVDLAREKALDQQALAKDFWGDVLDIS